MNQTAYKGLGKPLSTEKYNINVLNTNADIIDSELHKLDLKNENQDNLLATKEELNNHIDDKKNPHGTTKSHVGLSNVDNTSDMDKPVSNAQRKAIDEAVSNETDRAKDAEEGIQSVINSNKPNWDDKYTKNEIDNKIKTLEVNKVDKENGKGLSSNDYTTEEKNKLDGIEKYANNYIHPSSHPASIIEQDVNNRFVNDNQINKWDSILKESADYTDIIYQQATAFTLQKIADLIGGASSTMDTLEEIEKAMKEHKSVVDALDEAIGKKANQSEMDSLLATKLERTGDAANTIVTFSQATTRENVKSKEKLSTILGKIMKWFADLKTVAFTGAYSDLTDTPSAFDRSNDGLVPHPTTTTSTRFLREDGTWVVPTNTTYSAMSTSELTTGTATASRVVRADYLKAGIESIAESSDIDTANNTITFSQASARVNIASGENHKTIFGKIAKFLADLKTVAFTGSYNDLSDKPTIPTNTDVNVTQTNTTGSAAYRLLLSQNANDTTQTVGARKSSKFTANPSTGELTATTFIGGLKGDVTGFLYGGLNTIYVNSGTITLSEYRTAGIYAFGSGCVFSEDDPLPVGVNGYLIVLPMSGTNYNNVKQIWLRQGTAGSNDYYAYSRTLTSSTKGKWWGYIMYDDTNSTLGSSVEPIYLNNGTAKACSGRTVPGIKQLSAKGSAGWSTNKNYVPDMSFIAYWNGAYSDANNSNLTYCNKGAFGGAVTQEVANNLTTTAAGSVLDARQGKTLDDRITALENAIKNINTSLPYKITFDGTTMTVTDETRS